MGWESGGRKASEGPKDKIHPASLGYFIADDCLLRTMGVKSNRENSSSTVTDLQEEDSRNSIKFVFILILP
jgi:hypothetical protein